MSGRSEYNFRPVEPVPGGNFDNQDDTPHEIGFLGGRFVEESDTELPVKIPSPNFETSDAELPAFVPMEDNDLSDKIALAMESTLDMDTNTPLDEEVETEDASFDPEDILSETNEAQPELPMEELKFLIRKMGTEKPETLTKPKRLLKRVLLVGDIFVQYPSLLFMLKSKLGIPELVPENSYKLGMETFVKNRKNGNYVEVYEKNGIHYGIPSKVALEHLEWVLLAPESSREYYENIPGVLVIPLTKTDTAVSLYAQINSFLGQSS